MQDSTPILEHLEQAFPEPSLPPEDPALRCLSELLEEYGDEWGNKLMFHYRWGHPADQRHRAKTLAEGFVGGLTHPLLGKLLRPIVARMMVKRMVPRMAFAGANETNAPHLERSWFRTVELLEEHLSNRLYLFGARPAFGDFGIWGNLNQAYTDPTCGEHLSGHAPALVRWIERMDTPSAEGDFEPLEALLPTLGPLLSEQVAGRFLPWTLANARALEAGEPQTRLEFDGELYEQKTFKYHAWSFGKLKEKLLPVAADPQLRAVLEETGCAPFLA